MRSITVIAVGLAIAAHCAAQAVFTDTCANPDWFAACSANNACGTGQSGCLNNWFAFPGCGNACPLPFPDATADVVIPPGPIATLNGGTADIRSITALRPFVLGGGSLKLRASSTFQASLDWTGGGFNATSTAVTVLIPAGSPVAIYGDNGKSLAAAQLELEQGTSWENNGPIFLSDGAKIVNHAVFAARNDTSIANGGGDVPAFENLGRFLKLGSSGTTTISGVPFDNLGTLEVLSGTLRLSNTGTSYGPIELSPNTALDFAFGDYHFDAGTTVTGLGVVRVNGTLHLVADVDIDRLELQQSLQGPGDLRVVNAMTWSSGAMMGGGATVIPPAASLALVSANGKSLSDRRLQNNGLMTIADAGPLYLANASDVTNAGTLELASDASINYAGGTGSVLSNSGTLRKAMGAGTAVISNVPLNNTGLVDVQHGTLRLSNNGTSSGPFTLAAGTVLEFAFGNYNMDAGADVAGEGLVRLNGTTNLLGDVTFDHTELTNNLNGPGDLTVGGAMTWGSGTMAGGGATVIPPTASLTLASGNGKSLANRTLLNAGAVMVDDGGPLSLSNGAAVENAGIFDVRSDASIAYGGGAACALDNSGTLVKSAGTGLTTISGLPLNNTGLVDVQHGTLRLSNNGTSSGPFTLAAGTVLEFAFGNYNMDAGSDVAGEGLVRLNGTTNLLGDVTFDHTELANNLNGPGDLTVGDTLTWASGTMAGGGATVIPPTASLTLVSGNGKNLNNRTLHNAGAVMVDDGGPLFLSNGAAVENAGIFDVRSDASINYGGGGACALDNSGMLVKSAGTGLTTISGLPLNNTGLVDVQHGTLRLSNNGTSSGPFALTAGTVLEFAFGNYNMDAGSDVTGEGWVRLNGSTNLLGDVTFDHTELTNNLNGPCDLTVGETMTWASGTMAGGGATVIPPTASLTLLSGNGKNLNGRDLQNNGLIDWPDAGGVNLSNGALLHNAGTFDVHSDGTIGYGGGMACQVLNSGTLRKHASSGTTAVSNVAFVNSGALDVETGVLSVTNLTQTAGLTRIAAGATLQVGQALGLQGGALRGAGTVAGSVTNAGGSVQPGAFTGRLTVTGTYAQSGAGRLDIQLGGPSPATQHDQLVVSGAATLDGELQIAAVNGFVPAVGQQFVILTAGNVAGSFARITGPGTYSVTYTPTSAVLTVVAPPAPCVGDLNGDNLVNLMDLAIQQAHYGQAGNAAPADGDLDGDLDVDLIDADSLAARLGASCDDGLE